MPLYSSVSDNALAGPVPEAIKPAVKVPVPYAEFLVVFIFPPAVQLVPSYSSVFATDVVVNPPAAKAAV